MGEMAKCGTRDAELRPHFIIHNAEWSLIGSKYHVT